MINRRSFLASLIPLLLGTIAMRSWKELPKAQSNARAFRRILLKAKRENWRRCEMGELVARVGKEFLGVKYEGGTLEGESEQCRIKLDGLDCVTFFENSLGIARCIKMGESKFEDLIGQITFTRYRQGKIDGYLSRLHYTADWLYDNCLKETVFDLTEELGGERFYPSVNFMSTHPQFYAPLSNNLTAVEEVAKQELAVNSREYYYIKKENVAQIESKLKSGDILLITTNKNGLDYAHTGLALRHNDGSLRLLHASLTQKKVIIDVPLHEYLLGVSSHTGISVARGVTP